MTGVVLLFAGGLVPAQDLPAEAPRCDYEGPSGICVRFEPGARRFNPTALEAAFQQAKREVEARYALDLTDVRGPVVRVMPVTEFARLHPIQNRLDGDTGGDHGWTGFQTGQITLTGPAVMRHEAFHYLLLKTGYPNRLNALHDHPAFDEYRDGNWLPKRASATAPAADAAEAHAEPVSLSTPAPAGL